MGERMPSLEHWTAVPRPPRKPVMGRYATLAPLDPEEHAVALYEAAVAPGSGARFRYLAEAPPSASREAGLAELREWATAASESVDPMFFAVINRATGRAEGRQALMRIDEANGVAEIGHIMWGPAIARTRIATEALFLAADSVFALGYRRFEWKCHHDNAASIRAAARFGFTHEGTFRQHMVVKGENRDTEWFAVLDSEWPGLRAEYLRWLDPANFDTAGAQRSKLACSGAANAGR